MHNWCQSKTNLARNQSQSFYCLTKGNQPEHKLLLHEQEYDKIRTIVELTDFKFGLSANGLSSVLLPVGNNIILVYLYIMFRMF